MTTTPDLLRRKMKNTRSEMKFHIFAHLGHHFGHFPVVEVSTSKIGKHGHAKCHFVGIDVFNGKKYDDIVASSHITVIFPM